MQKIPEDGLTNGTVKGYCKQNDLKEVALIYIRVISEFNVDKSKSSKPEITDICKHLMTKYSALQEHIQILSSCLKIVI